MKYHLLFFKTFAFLILSIPVWGQNELNHFKEISPRTPNAASLGKYGDIPIGYHTGIPEISIPIYTIQEGPLSLPVSLSYHSSGIKTDEVSSWVGLGWSLHAGGMISRSVMGAPDEGTSETTGSCSFGHPGWGWYRNHGMPPQIATPILCDPERGLANGSYDNDPTKAGKYCVDYFLDAANGIVDSEPDLFTYNFPGGAGKFVFDETGKIYTFPWEDYYIQPVNNNESSNQFFNEWKLITPDGTKYFFGGANATEKSYQNPQLAIGDNAKNNYNTVWYLYRMESINNTHWIEFSYENENYMIANRWPHNFNLLDGTTEGAKPVLTFTKVKGIRLKKIITSSGNTTIDFVESHESRQDLNAYGSWTETNTEAKPLYKIKIYGNNNFCKEFVLNTDYFESDENSAGNYTSLLKTDLKRLRLNSVQEHICNSEITIPPYVFFYNNTKMARRFSCAKDNWGYYNGADNNTGLVPTLIFPDRNTNYIPFGPVDRNCNEVKSKSWILERIKYPTNGEVIFDYEVNKIDHGSYAGEMRGGLRIKRITKRSIYSKDMITDYVYFGTNYYGEDPHLNDFYVDNPLSNSDLHSWSTLPRTGNVDDNPYDYGLEIQGTPKAPEYSTQGYHIGYESVKEKRPDGSYTEYVYHANIIPKKTSFPSVPSQNPIGKGVLAHKYVRDADGNTKSESHYNYDWTADFKEITAKKVSVANIYNFPSSGSCEHSSLNVAPREYILKTMRLRLKEQIETVDGITNTVAFSYDPLNKHKNPVATTKINSEGKSLVSEFVYPSDVDSGAPVEMFDQGNPNYKNMLGLHMETIQKVNGIPLKKEQLSYTLSPSNGFINLTKSKSYPTMASAAIEYSYTQDENDNVINIKQEHNIDASYLWGYNNSFPIAEIKNAQNTKKIVSTTATATTGSKPFSIRSSYATVDVTVDYVGTVTLKLGNQLNSYVGIAYSGITTGYAELEANTACGYHQIVFSNVQPGKYQLKLNLSTGISSYEVCGRIEYPELLKNHTYEGITEAYYQSFEETSFAVTEDPAKAHTGKRYYPNDYQVDFTLPNNRSYFIEYWYLDYDQKWKQIRKPYAGPSVILSEGTAVDDIRIFPTDALMTTYTYDPLVGVTSVTDPSNKTMYYEYDQIGRLNVVRDENKNIIKKYDYNYQLND